MVGDWKVVIKATKSSNKSIIIATYVRNTNKNELTFLIHNQNANTIYDATKRCKLCLFAIFYLKKTVLQKTKITISSFKIITNEFLGFYE